MDAGDIMGKPKFAFETQYLNTDLLNPEGKEYLNNFKDKIIGRTPKDQYINDTEKYMHDGLTPPYLTPPIKYIVPLNPKIITRKKKKTTSKAKRIKKDCGCK